MQSRSTRNLAKTILVSIVLASLQACSPPTGVNSVSDAYHSSDTIAIQPYTRTIFSSNNF